MGHPTLKYNSEIVEAFIKVYINLAQYTVSAIKNARVKKRVAILCRFMGQLYIDKLKQFLF